MTVSVTVSPTLASPPTVPVIATVPPASAALITSSAVMFEVSVIVGAGAVRSTVTANAPEAAPVLPECVTSAVTLTLPSPCAVIAAGKR